MAFHNIIGQSGVKGFFERAIESDRLSHAYLFVGARGVGKEAMAMEVAKALLEKNDPQSQSDSERIARLTHPDVHVVFPAPAKITEDDRRKIIDSLIENPYMRLQPWANPSISIASIRDLRRKSSYKSFEGKGRVFLIFDCDKMTVEAANSLLKILEEPPEKMYLIMTSSNPNVLLPTITSRCQLIKFSPLSADEIELALVEKQGVEKQKARLTAKLAGGSYRRGIELLEEDLGKMQQRALEFFRKSVQSSYMQILYVDELLSALNRDAKSIQDLLGHLLLWFRDAIIYRELQDPDAETLIHHEQIDVLKNFNSKFPDADLDAAVQEIEYAVELMSRNVQLNLILIVLLNKVRAFIRRSG